MALLQENLRTGHCAVMALQCQQDDDAGPTPTEAELCKAFTLGSPGGKLVGSSKGREGPQSWPHQGSSFLPSKFIPAFGRKE